MPGGVVSTWLGTGGGTYRIFETANDYCVFVFCFFLPFRRVGRTNCSLRPNALKIPSRVRKKSYALCFFFFFDDFLETCVNYKFYNSVGHGDVLVRRSLRWTREPRNKLVAQLATECCYWRVNGSWYFQGCARFKSNDEPGRSVARITFACIGSFYIPKTIGSRAAAAAAAVAIAAAARGTITWQLSEARDKCQKITWTDRGAFRVTHFSNRNHFTV